MTHPFILMLHSFLCTYRFPIPLTPGRTTIFSPSISTKMASTVNDVKETQRRDGDQDKSPTESGSIQASSGDVLSLGQVDHALTAKMKLVNDVRLITMEPFTTS